MYNEKERWQAPIITDEMVKQAEERRRQLNEREDLRQIEMPIEKLEDIHREIERRNTEKERQSKARIRFRPKLVAAAVLVLVLGIGGVCSGNDIYLTQIFQEERGNETTSKIENITSVYSEYNEETVCQEIQEKLGVLPVRLYYRPNELTLRQYILSEQTNEAVLAYENEQGGLHIYITKDYQKSTFNFQSDGELLGMAFIENKDMEVPIYLIKNEDGAIYYGVEFEYLNAYYSISGNIEMEEFQKIVENISIKNV